MPDPCISKLLTYRWTGAVRRPLRRKETATAEKVTRESARRLRLRAVALLELLARPAPAGVVAADLVDRVDAPLRDARPPSSSRGSRRLGDAERAPRPRRASAPSAVAVDEPLEYVSPPPPAQLELLDSAGSGTACSGSSLAVDFDLDVEDHAREVGPDRVHQVLEELEALVLVRDQRVDLGEPAQADALAQVVHVVEVLAPALVDGLEQQVALEHAHQLLAELASRSS